MAEPKDLRNLVAVYEHCHFGKAAQETGLSQPAITKSIQRLEKEFGLALFDRSRSHVGPTPICEAIVSRANSVLSGLENLDQMVRMFRGLEAGSLTIGVGPAMSESYITQAIGSLAQDHPGIQVDVRVDHWKQLSEWIISGEIEILVADLAEVADDKRFVVSPLPAQEFIWFCNSRHPLAEKERVSRHDLLQYPLATPRMPPWAIGWFHAVLTEEERNSGSVPLPTIRCENYSMLKRIVLDSNCVSAALAATIRPEVQSGLLTTLPVDAASLTTEAGIVQLSDRTPSPLANALVNKIVDLAAVEH
ncbi:MULTISPECIES: LysR family transcriptional regulator [Bythopirellula]|uniref:HTH-type transcriptional regulator GbpR n=2 Tax=Bythopirellula TaxID=1400386 RepID=A0A5C6C9Z7_9BACT|nr:MULTISPECIES: LysR family transcriptional regulator [Bythopirellula]QEG33496.1 HTH-type transcriptional regulator GbpR [Bythopirellula goksoeyrii]TWU21410.1 HTH-type transcriptional regulator GbpR [Bythopirellula polymerisocia]